MKLVVLALPVLVAACSSTYMREAAPSGPPGSDESKVVFCRPSRFVGSAITFPVWDDVKLLGFAETGSYFEYRCKPGYHIFLTSSEVKKAIEAEFAAGKTYYVWVTPRMGWLSARVGFTPVTRESELAGKVDEELRESRCRELDPDRGRKYEASNRERMQNFKDEIKNDPDKEILKLKPEDGR